MDRETAQAWLDRYVAAWKSYDREDIAALFAPTVQYRYHPYDEAIVGVDAVVDSWLGEGGTDGAVDARRAGHLRRPLHAVRRRRRPLVATGTSVYQDHPDGPVAAHVRQLLPRALRPAGRCLEFTELYMERPTTEPGVIDGPGLTG